MIKNNIQEKYLEFQLLNQKLNQLHQQLNLAGQQLMELKLMEESLSNLEKVKLGTKIFSSIGPGIFVKSELKDNKEVLMNIGVSTVVKKTISSATMTISKKAEEVNEVIKQLERQVETISNELYRIQEEIIEIKK